jgi:hypothetical protein
MTEVENEYPNCPGSMYWTYISAKLGVDSSVIIEEVQKDLSYFNDRDTAITVKSGFSSNGA